MKIVSWNVAGINSCVSKGLFDFVKKENADIYCFQEVKATKEKMPPLPAGFHVYHSYAQKKGYSGVTIMSKTQPLAIVEGIGREEFDSEGRTLTAEFNDFFLINVYFPHSQRELARLNYKMKFNNLFLDFCNKLSKVKPIIIASDFNVAHEEIDLANPKSNMKNAGFTKEEREWFTYFLNAGYIDTFREFNKSPGQYTWWTFRNDARKRNIGWRIDYFVISQSLKNKLKSSKILSNILGSDHCPIELEIN